MNPMTDNLSDEAFIAQIRQSAQAIQPNVDFAANLEQTLNAAAQSKEHKPTIQTPRIIRLMGSAAAVLLLVSVGILTVPPLRLLAQQIIDFVTRSSSNQETMPMSSFASPEYQTFTSVVEAEVALGRDIVEPHVLFSSVKGSQNMALYLETVSFHSISSHEVVLQYQAPEPTPSASGLIWASNSRLPWWAWFTQTSAEIYHKNIQDIKVGESAQIETVTFNFRGHEVTAQFIQGAWVAGMSQDELEAMDNGETIQAEMTWIDNGQMKLIWEDEGIVYALNTVDEDMFQLTRDDVIRMAESIE